MRVSAPVRAAAQRLVLPVLLLTSIMLILLGKADVLLLDRVRVALSDASAPLLDALAQPAATVAGSVQKVEDLAALYRQNVQLREENARLLQWHQAALRLEADNTALRRLTKLVPDNPISYIAARVVADLGGAFVRNVLINAGRRDGVARGQAAATGEGLVGRVSEVGEGTARVLLLTDLNSHVPVMLERTHERAMLEGDNTDQPRLIFLQAKSEAKPGDRIVTSGSGGVFPPGLPVGVVAAADSAVGRVEPFAELARLEIVRVIDYGLAGVLPQSAVPPPAAPRTGKGGKAPGDAER